MPRRKAMGSDADPAASLRSSTRLRNAALKKENPSPLIDAGQAPSTSKPTKKTNKGMKALKETKELHHLPVIIEGGGKMSKEDDVDSSNDNSQVQTFKKIDKETDIPADVKKPRKHAQNGKGAQKKTDVHNDTKPTGENAETMEFKNKEDADMPQAEEPAKKGKQVSKQVQKKTDLPDMLPSAEKNGANNGDENIIQTQKTPKRTLKTNAPADEPEDKKPRQELGATFSSDLDLTTLTDCVNINAKGAVAYLKIISWNVGGLRAAIKKNAMDYLINESADIVCLQEIRCSRNDLPAEINNLKGYHKYWNESKSKASYAGCAIWSKIMPLNVMYGIGNEELDQDGRAITAEYKNFYVVCLYVPNAGRKLVTLPKRLEWNKEFLNFVKKLDEMKPVIIAGDMNVAHNEIDLSNPKRNTKNAGFTKEERDGMTEFLGEGFVDTFRHFNPSLAQYTFWTYMANARAKNIGWRLDYVLTSERLIDDVCDSRMRSDVLGSDHCPIVFWLGK